MKELVFHHKQGIADGIHIPHSFEYDNEAQRISATGFTLLDLSKLALQKDDNTFWSLVSISPIVWTPVSFPSSIYNKLTSIANVSNVETKLDTLRTLVPGDNITITEQGTDELLISSSGGGVTAHGALTGLNLDHHVQYLNVTRHQTPGLHELTRIIGGTLIGTVPHDDLDGLTNVTIDNDALLPDDVLMFRSGVWQNLPLPVVSSSQNGLMLSADKVALDGLIGSSDSRLKKDIKPIVNAIEILEQLEGVYFHWDKEVERTADFSDKREIGFVAQQVEGILPEIVGEDSHGYKLINYGKVVALLTEAIKSQQKQIKSLETRVRILERLR